MKIQTLICLLSINAFSQSAEPNLGLKISKICYDTVDSTQFCTTDNIGNVQVFIYNAGWCPPCNDEMAELSANHSQFNGKKVTFASLSAEGFMRGTKPVKAFLEKWKKKHGIPFVVAGKYKDFGLTLGSNGSIPFTFIVDSKGIMAKKGNLDVSEIHATTHQLLQDMENEPLNPKTFFEKIRGEYKVETVASEPPHDPSLLGVVYSDAEFPNLEMVSMPYCVGTACMDSGNFFVYDTTTVTQTEKGFHWVLKSEGKDLHYDWEDDGAGRVVYRNHQFVPNSGPTVVLEHVLRMNRK